MSRFMKLLLAIIMSSLLLVATAAAQSAATAELHVSVKDPNGLVVKNATVTAVDTARNITRAAAERGDGEYQFLALPPGQYSVTVQAPGFAKVIAKDVTVNIGQRAELPMVLQVASVEAVVNVTGEAELVETQRSAPTTTISEGSIQNLPINGRNYINFAETDSKLARDTTPSIGAAPTSGINFGGQRARANLVNVDGADAVDNSTNGIRSTVSQDAVQEFQIITNGYAAEYGRASGGVVNIITRSGTNALHGTAYGYLRNRKIQAVNPFSNTSDPAYTRVQAGFTLGGPIKKDKTFYFLSYETTRRRETGFSNIGANSFDLVHFNASTLAPFLGANFGNDVLLTADQAAFFGKVGGGLAALPPATQAAILLPPPGGAGLGTLLAQYLIAAGGGAGIAVNGALPSLTMAGAIATTYNATKPYPTYIPFMSTTPGGACAPATSGGTIPCLGVFPSSGYKLPANFVPLSSIIGNFPITEGSTVISARIDHQLTTHQQLMLRAGVSPSTVTGIEPQAQGPQVKGLNAWSRTSDNQFRDFNIIAHHVWTLGLNKVNELQFQYARRGVGYTYSKEAPGGSYAGINIAGYGFFGREPFSPVNRTEKRWQFTDSFSLTKGSHTFKWGGDFNYLPLKADFTVNFGAVWNVGAWSAGQLFTDSSGKPITTVTLPGATPIPIPSFTAVQSYGLGMPSYLVQGVGNPHDQFSNKVFAGFVQDTWRVKSNLTLNYGVRYDVELTPVFPAVNAYAAAAEQKLGIVEGIPRDYNNFAPRIGIAWDPWKNGKTVVRASYGMFYDHPLLALAFDSDVADGSQAPQIILSTTGLPGWSNTIGLVSCLNAANVFQGVFATCPAAQPGGLPGGLSFNYLPDQQRFDGTPNAPNQVFANQNFLSTTPPVPLALLPLGFPVASNFVYPYSQQANLTIERDLGHNFALSLEYNFNGGHHLYRPINVNAVRPDLLVQNFFRANAGLSQFKNTLTALAASPSPLAAAAAGVLASYPGLYGNPLAVTACPSLLIGQMDLGLTAAGAGAAIPSMNALATANLSSQGTWTSAPLVSFFRPSGVNPALATNFPFSACMGEAAALGITNQKIPFSDMMPNISNGSSVYHGFSVNLRKRMSNHYEFLASYTWSHAIDDSTDLQTTLAPQDNFNPAAERSNSTFDQRHRLVFSAVLQSGKLAGQGFMSKFMSNWTLAPIIDVSSGRPFNIITGIDRNFDDGATDRPMIVAGAGTNSCGDAAVATKFSPTGWLQPACFLDGTLVGNLGRNTGIKPWTVFTDLRVARRLNITERLKLDAIADMFNLINRNNTLDVDTLYTGAGRAVSSFDPRQFQLALKLTW